MRILALHCGYVLCVSGADVVRKSISVRGCDQPWKCSGGDADSDVQEDISRYVIYE